jgi:catechol 2,3-dioxygenase-like lactoylglutathione lyase family enzyme
MFDHVSVRVADLPASERFYDTVLPPLGMDSTYRTNTFVVWDNFALSEADDEATVTRGVHVAFAAATREQVDAFWQAGLDAGHPDDGAPGLRPQYADDSYGAFLRDPDGNSVEAVHLERRQRAGVIDHLWIRVADLAASTAFYRTIADAAGLVAQEDGPQRATFADGRGSDVSLSLLPGDATQNLHLAFPGDDDAVRRFHDGAVAAGYQSNGEPGERARYHPGYYAAYVLDPDGNNLEVVNHHRD